MRRICCWVLPVALLLSGCGPVIRFTDDSKLTLDRSLAGRWAARVDNERQEVQITASGKSCGLAQLQGETESYRLCSIAAAGDYRVLAAHELDEESASRADRPYALWMVHWLGPDRLGSVPMQVPQVIEQLGWPATAQKDAECAAKPADEQSRCADYTVDPATLPAADAEALARLYAGAIAEPDDQTFFERIPEGRKNP